ELAGPGIEDRLHEALGLAAGHGAAVGDEREATDAQLVAALGGLPLAQPYARHLRPAVGAGRHARRIERVHPLDSGDALHAEHALVARLVREPGRADEVADGVEPGLRGREPAVDDDVPLLDARGRGLEAQILDLARDADREDGALEAPFEALAVAELERGDPSLPLAPEPAHAGLGVDLDPALLEGAPRRRRHLLVLGREDARQDLHDGHLRA